MQVHRETHAIIDALQDPVLIVESRRGGVIACNAAFVQEMGLSEESIKGKSFFRIPQFTRSIRRGLLDLYIEKLKNKRGAKAPFVFQLLDAQGKQKTFSANLDLLDCGEQKLVMVFLRISKTPKTTVLSSQVEDLTAFNALVAMMQEPWMEFRSRSPHIPVVLSDNDRLSYLLNLGRKFVVHKASPTAQKLFGKKISGMGVSGVSLKGKDFISLFYREEDALRFLDMLSNVGHLRAPATLLSESGEIIEVELICSVNFDSEDVVTALYCIPYHNEHDRSLAIQNLSSHQEQDFLFSQPFLGIGHLVPLQPLSRPEAADADTTLNNYLNEILLLNANNALSSLYGVEKNELLMKRMGRLFPHRAAGIQVLRELFVRRQSSFATYDEDTGELLRVAIFKALFNDADRLIRIFLAVSPQVYGLQERLTTPQPRSTPTFI